MYVNTFNITLYRLVGKKAEDNPLLLDYTLMSKHLCREKLSLVVNGYAGSVKYEAFDVCNGGATVKSLTSDHRPVSCKFDPT